MAYQSQHINRPKHVQKPHRKPRHLWSVVQVHKASMLRRAWGQAPHAAEEHLWCMVYDARVLNHTRLLMPAPGLHVKPEPAMQLPKHSFSKRQEAID